MHRLTTEIHFEKCVIRWFHHHANVTECTLHKPWNLAFTWPPYRWKSFETSVSRIERFHPYWRFALASHFPPQSAYLEFPKILTTIIYTVRQRLKRCYAAHDCIHLAQSVWWIRNTVDHTRTLCWCIFNVRLLQNEHNICALN
jgi:hypothetical protein